MSAGQEPDDTSFLSRWSRRKVEAKVEPRGAANAELSNASTGEPAGTKMPETPHPEPTLPAEPPATHELPAIEGLTHEGNFMPFMAKDIDPGLRNQAMKKLFADPHYQFGQMDKLDIYIDDYSKSDPIPLEMLRKMNQAKSLFLFDDEDDEAPQPPIAGATINENSVQLVTDATISPGAAIPAASNPEGLTKDADNAPNLDRGLVAEPNNGNRA
jgi:hypothetical protein